MPNYQCLSNSGSVGHSKDLIDLLIEFSCLHVSCMVSPLDIRFKLSVDSGDPLPVPSLYKKLVGK